MKFYNLVPILLLLLCIPQKETASLVRGGNDIPDKKTSVDFTQAELMLDFLKSLGADKPNPEKIENLLNASGTGLIIKQMNLARKVTLDQYRQLLLNINGDEFPNINPVDSSERAKRGIDGLRKEVWTILQWARDHTQMLEKNMASFKEMDLFGKAKTLTMKNLPEQVDISPSLFVVMGGRAGFAALEDGNIYYDILLTTFLQNLKNKPMMEDSELTEFFAHEIHHIGLGKIINQKFSGINFSDSQRRVMKFLNMLALEGGATYLINGHRDIERLRSDPGYSNYLEKSGKLLNNCENIIRSASSGEIENDNDFDKATSSMMGNSFHSAGSAILSVIDKAKGFDAIMEVLSDPRLLLIEFNEAVKTLPDDSVKIYSFDNKLAEEISKIGN